MYFKPACLDGFAWGNRSLGGLITWGLIAWWNQLFSGMDCLVEWIAWWIDRLVESIIQWNRLLGGIDCLVD